MAEDKKEPWLNYLALTTVIIAVCASLSTFRGSSYSTKSVINQTMAADQWAFYQAKSIKGYLYELQRDAFEMDMLAQEGKLDARHMEIYAAKLQAYDSTIARYDREKSDIQKEARKFETVRNDCQQHSKVFGIAVIYLQIAVLLSSVAALMKKKPVWYCGMIVGAVGVVYFVYAFFVMPA